MSPIWILIANNKVKIAELNEIHLEKEDYRVVKATDGKETIRIIQSKLIDVVILDRRL